MFNNYLMSFLYMNASSEKNCISYPHDIPFFRKQDGENISEYYEKNGMGANEFLLMSNCSCLVNLEKKDHKVKKFCITAIIKNTETESDKWIYLRYDFDIKENPNLWTHTAPHLHIEIQKDNLDASGNIVNDYIPSELRIPSHKVSKNLVFEILENICKISNFKEWFDARLGYVKENEILNEHYSIIQEMTNNENLVDLILRNEGDYRTRIDTFNKDLFKKMNEMGYLDIEIDPECEQCAKIFNFDVF